MGLWCGMWDLAPWPGVKPRPSVLRAWSLSHWATREVCPQSLKSSHWTSPWPEICCWLCAKHQVYGWQWTACIRRIKELRPGPFPLGRSLWQHKGPCKAECGRGGFEEAEMQCVLGKEEVTSEGGCVVTGPLDLSRIPTGRYEYLALLETLTLFFTRKGHTQGSWELKQRQ